MTLPDLRADCARCAALCCVALAFDRGGMFAYDKPAGEPCRHLQAAGGCAIHARRAAEGFAGCIAYDCLGAGSRVTAELFGGRDWREAPELLGPMMQAFSAVERAHRGLALLAEAAKLPLSPLQKGQLSSLAAALTEAGGDLEAVMRLDAPTQAFLRSLGDRVRRRG